MMKKSNTGCSTTRRAILDSPPEPYLIGNVFSLLQFVG